MKLGICLPNNWGLEDVQSIFRLATRAEELGFDSVWVSEHVFNTSYILDRIGSRPYYDPLAILSYLAAVTRRISLGTSVLVLPYHNPIRLAKTAATLDVMCGGRLKLGVGVGVIEEEIIAMGGSMAERAAISDEAIAIMKELWTQDDPSFQGRYHSFSGMKFSPRPVQKPHVPLLVGGISRAAIRRAVSAGNGWHAMTLSPDELAPLVGYLGEIAVDAGRALSEVPVSIRLDMHPPGTDRRGRTGRYTLDPDPEEVLAEVHRFEALGVDEIAVSLNSGEETLIHDTMDMLARHVLPSLE